MNIPSQPAPGMGAPAPTPTAPGYDVYVGKYRALREKVKEIKDRHAAELEPYNAAMAGIENHLRVTLQTSGMESLKTSQGTAYLSTTKSYVVKDGPAFRSWCQANGEIDLFENRVSKTVLEERLASGGSLPPGIEVSQFVKLNIRA